MKKQIKQKLLYILLSVLYINNYSWGQQAQELKDALQMYDYTKAAELLEIYNDSIPVDTKLDAYKTLNRHKEGIALLESLIQQDSLNKRHYIKLADFHSLTGNNNAAINNYLKAIDEEKPNQFLLFRIASLQFQDNKVQQAINTLDWAMSVDTIQRNLRLQAKCYQSLDSTQTAIKLYNTAVKRDSTDAYAVVGLSQLFIDEGIPKAAIYYTDKYLQFDSTNVAVNRINAQAYFLNNQHREALEKYTALTLNGDSITNTLYYQGLCYMNCDSILQAYTNFVFVNKRARGQNPNIMGYLGITSLEMNYIDEGIDLLNKAISLSQPSSTQMDLLYTNLAKGYSQKENAKMQIAALKKSYEYVRRAQTLYAIACVYDSSKDVNNAEKYYTLFIKELDNFPQLTTSVKKMKSGAQERLEYYKQERFFKQGK